MIRGLVASAAAGLLIACGGSAAPADPVRAQLVSAVPPDAVRRGVYVFDPSAGPDVTPGSLVAPLIGASLQTADLVVETGAPPLTVMAGVEGDVPAPAVTVDRVTLFGAPDDIATAQSRVKGGAQADPLLAALAATDAPVAWIGPLPVRDGRTGTLLLTADAEHVEMRVRAGPAHPLADTVRRGLAEGAPPSSPGKPWREILADPQVRVDGDDVVISARRADLPGALLRSLIDTRSLSFLSNP